MKLPSVVYRMPSCVRFVPGGILVFLANRPARHSFDCAGSGEFRGPLPRLDWPLAGLPRRELLKETRFAVNVDHCALLSIALCLRTHTPIQHSLTSVPPGTSYNVISDRLFTFTYVLS